MSIIEVNADLKNCVHQLTRIADALDIILEYQYGYRTRELLEKPVAKSSEEESLEYTTDESAALEEVRAAIEEMKRGKSED